MHLENLTTSFCQNIKSGCLGDVAGLTNILELNLKYCGQFVGSLRELVHLLKMTSLTLGGWGCKIDGSIRDISNLEVCKLF